MPLDRFVCKACGWTWEGPCVPHEEHPGDSNEEIGAHSWVEHQSVADALTDYTFEHLP